MIKRKNNINISNNSTIEYDKLLNDNSQNKKKVSRNSLERIVMNLNKNVYDTAEKQKSLEKKIEGLIKQNDKYMNDYQKIFKEIVNKSYKLFI